MSNQDSILSLSLNYERLATLVKPLTHTHLVKPN